MIYLNLVSGKAGATQFLGLMRSFNDRQREAVRAGLDALNAGASQAEVKRIMEAGWKAA